MKKKIIYGAGAVILLAAIAWGAQYLSTRTQVAMKDPCSLDIQSLVLKDDGSFKTDEAITRGVFDNYFAEYTRIPNCPATALKGSRLVSVGTPKYDTPDKKHFVVDITFDLQPMYPDATKWFSSEASTTTEPGWITGKKGTMSIRKGDGIFYLVL